MSSEFISTDKFNETNSLWKFGFFNPAPNLAFSILHQIWLFQSCTKFGFSNPAPNLAFSILHKIWLFQSCTRTTSLYGFSAVRWCRFPCFLALSLASHGDVRVYTHRPLITLTNYTNHHRTYRYACTYVCMSVCVYVYRYVCIGNDSDLLMRFS